ncbi:MAG: type II toxin-antitoxin system RelB/DinJ family antitoxin [Clostridia bacterium]|nr:type II toxin-antitoxin system RelB/DinJ family antitoxin [Clostridia bacterium]
MARSANVMVRVEPDVKEKAEMVMSQLGLSASTAINLFYRQMIVERGLPFKPSTAREFKPLNEMTKAEFDERMAVGYTQAVNGRVRPASDVFNDLLEGLGDA